MRTVESIKEEFSLVNAELNANRDMMVYYQENKVSIADAQDAINNCADEYVRLRPIRHRLSQELREAGGLRSIKLNRRSK